MTWGYVAQTYVIVLGLLLLLLWAFKPVERGIKRRGNAQARRRNLAGLLGWGCGGMVLAVLWGVAAVTACLFVYAHLGR